LGKELDINLEETYSCYIGRKKHCGRCLACRLRRAGFYWANIVYKDQVNKVIVGVVDVDPVKGLLIRIWAAPHYDLYEGWIQEIDLNGAVITWANKIEAPADDK